MSGDNKRTRYVVISLSSIFLVAIVVIMAIGLTQNDDQKIEEKGNGATEGPTTSQRNVQLLCQTTKYQETCKKSLLQASKKTSNIKELIKVGFNATAVELQKHIENYMLYKELAEDSMTRQAMDICYNLMRISVDDINRSVDRLNAFELDKLDEFAYEIKVWLSATITHQQTCLDGFENTSTNASRTMTQALKTSIELSSNALAMIAGLPKSEKDLGIQSNRKLLSEDGYPSWVSDSQRQLLQAGPSGFVPNAIVAQDGSGQYMRLTDALNAVPIKNAKPFVIYVKAGVYNEKVGVGSQVNYVTVIGDGPTKTRFTGSLNYKDHVQTFDTATFTVQGSFFIAKDIGFENTAGAVKEQAIALLVVGDAAVFHNCHIDGYQDTLCAHSYRQFYRDCSISGTIDFIFGAGEAVFQNCKVIMRKPLDNQQCIVLAGGKENLAQPSALVLQSCHFTAAPEFMAVKGTVKAYLGRPWKMYAKTVIMDSKIDNIFEAEGYHIWEKKEFHNTCSFYEYNNKGYLANALAMRVKWPDVKQISADEAMNYYPARFFELTNRPGKDQWILASAVPYSSGPKV